MLYHLLYPIHESISAFRIFRYITFRTVAATLTALFICLIVGPYLIRFLQKKQLGQVVRDDGPKTHLKKAGTPTMGGLLILLAVSSATLLWARLDSLYIWLVLFVSLGLGGVGFLDDWIKLKRNKKGLSPRHKMRLQLLIALITSCVLLMGDQFPSMPELANFDTRIFLPFLKGVSFNIGWFFVVWVILVIVGSSNAVNLTDGLDGLAIGPVITASVTFIVLTYISGNATISEYLNISYIRKAGELSIFCGALFGAGLGFLWYNTYPAQVFMGDVGSLSIGGALGFECGAR
jgi:phospho-N-acetylmuramoyl-pentapeptide-transferase